jgi:small subunit ribosomal protein S14
MAKKSILARELKKQAEEKRLQPKVNALREIITSGNDEARFEAIMELSKLPRNFSPVRQSRRCRCCGRPRGVYRIFGLCRICLRQAAMRGDIPGLVKASW